MGLRRAFQQLKIVNPLTVARDGIEALEILRGGSDRTPLPRPYLILLDLNMPRMNGIEFLHALRADATLRDAIAFVLTTSRVDEDRIAAYQHNVAGYIVKSDFGNGFLHAVRLLKHYWRVVEFP
jgi:CheY-like chemotaxis protein